MTAGCNECGTAWARSAVVFALTVLVAVAVSAVGVHAQEPDTAVSPPWPRDVQEVDRVVAIVGDTAILLSELRQELFQLQAKPGGPRIPPEYSKQWTSLAHTVIAAMADRLIAMQEAKRLGLTPDADQVQRLSDDYYEQARQGFASDEQMAEAVESSGMNMLQYRQMLRAQAEAEALLQAFRFSLSSRTDLPPVVVNESEVEEYFRANAADQTRPPLVTFNQLIVTPFPHGAARDSAIARARQVIKELDEGQDFEVVARRHSDDEGTRDSGGELGWMRRDDLVKEFADAAWAATPGTRIGPIQTRLGLHIIKIENARGGERFIRHVLIRPELGKEDLDKSRELGMRLADSLRAGADPEALRRANPEVAADQIRFDDIPIQQLTGRFKGDAAAALAKPTPGEVYGPFEVDRGGGVEYVIIHVLRYRPAGPAELDDFRDLIRQTLQQTKQIDAMIQEIRSNTFIDIKL